MVTRTRTLLATALVAISIISSAHAEDIFIDYSQMHHDDAKGGIVAGNKPMMAKFMRDLGLQVGTYHTVTERNKCKAYYPDDQTFVRSIDGGTLNYGGRMKLTGYALLATCITGANWVPNGKGVKGQAGYIHKLFNANGFVVAPHFWYHLGG